MATYSISGNAGVAAAYVSIFGYNPAVATSVTADGSGNYTFTGISAGTYFVVPSLGGYIFGPDPSYATVTVVAVNLTGVNFTAAAIVTPAIPAWTKLGQVLSATSTTGAFFGAQAGTVIYEGNPVILSGNVFKLWYYDGTNTCYAESSTGLPGSFSTHIKQGMRTD